MPRRRVLKAGVIAYNERYTTMPCSVRDLSETGAKLLVANGASVPDTFELHIELDGTWVGCVATWRRADCVGARFTSPVMCEAPTRKQVLTASRPAVKPSLRRKPVGV